MRPALYHRESHHPTGTSGNPAAPARAAAPSAPGGADSSLGLALRIAQARRDARLHPAEAAMLLRSWMSDHG